ncbi:MAG: BatD family protein [Candidatus Zixiibacteriota bacterium]
MLITETRDHLSDIITYFMVRLILAAMVVASLAASAKAEISFTSHVDKVQAAFEDEFKLTLEVTVSDPTMTTTPAPPPDIIGFRIGGSGSSVEKQGALTIRRYTYNLKPARSGEVTIPAFQVEFKGASSVDTLSSDPIVVNVDQPKPRPEEKSSFGYIIAIAVAIVAGIGYFLYSRRKNMPVATNEPDWREEAKKQFAEIKKMAEREDFRQFSAQAMKFAVGLVERKFETRLTGYTSTDILRWMEEQGVEKEIRDHSRELFGFCEEVKFSSGKVEVQSGRNAVANATKLVELILK